MEKPAIKTNDWVRVLDSSSGVPSPNKHNSPIEIYDAILVLGVSSQGGRGGGDGLIYLANKSKHMISSTEVEKIENCICPKVAKESVGCKCGYQTMINKIEESKKKKQSNKDQIFLNMEPVYGHVQWQIPVPLKPPKKKKPAPKNLPEIDAAINKIQEAQEEEYMQIHIADVEIDDEE